MIYRCALVFSFLSLLLDMSNALDPTALSPVSWNSKQALAFNTSSIDSGKYFALSGLLIAGDTQSANIYLEIFDINTEPGAMSYPCLNCNVSIPNIYLDINMNGKPINFSYKTNEAINHRACVYEPWGVGFEAGPADSLNMTFHHS
jgi:hypothetical protein